MKRHVSIWHLNVEGATAILDWLRDLIEIYTWSEVWIVVSVPVIVTGVWFLFALMLSVQNQIVRATAIWSLLFVLTIGSAGARAVLSTLIDYFRKRRKSRPMVR